MKRMHYFILTMILLTSSCASPDQAEKEATSSVKVEVVVSTATSTLSAPLPTIALTSTVESVHLQEPILVTKYVFSFDYLTINDVYFIDENNGWAVGNLEWYEQTVSSIACCKPKLFNTTDGGASWNEVETGTTSGLLNSIVWTDSMAGYIIGQQSFFDDANALVLSTTDGGKNWKRVDGNQQSGTLNYVMVTKSNQFWSVGEDYNNSQYSRRSLILRSADGLNWNAQEHPSEIGAELTTITFPSEKVGYAVGFVGHDSPDPYITR